MRGLRKYGKDGFVLDTICTCATLEELNEKESSWIKDLNSSDPRYGYNTRNAISGAGSLGEKSAAKISKAKLSRSIKVEQYDENGVLVATYNSPKEAGAATGLRPRTISRICSRELYKGSRLTRTGGYTFFYQGDFSEQEIQYRFCPIQTGRGVVAYNESGAMSFDSLIEAEDILLTRKIDIRRAIKRGASHIGFKWVYLDTLIPKRIRKPSLFRRCNTKGAPSRQVAQYSADGSLVKTFKTTAAANRELGLRIGIVKAICDGKQKKSAGGHTFFYEGDYSDEELQRRFKHEFTPFNKKPIIQIKGDIEIEHPSIAEAARAVGIKGSTLSGAMSENKKAKGFLWRFK
jgi:hypothetical protein